MYFSWYRHAKEDASFFYNENDSNLKDIEALQKANEDFKIAHEELSKANQLHEHNRKVREQYINEVIQPMIFQRRQKFLELDGIAYEMFSVVEIITKYPKCINIIPVNLWNQISDELSKQQSYELLSQMQNYRQRYPFKFTKISFGECFYRAPLWNLPEM